VLYFDKGLFKFFFIVSDIKYGAPVLYDLLLSSQATVWCNIELNEWLSVLVSVYFQ